MASNGKYSMKEKIASLKREVLRKDGMFTFLVLMALLGLIVFITTHVDSFMGMNIILILSVILFSIVGALLIFSFYQESREKQNKADRAEIIYNETMEVMKRSKKKAKNQNNDESGKAKSGKEEDNG